ncbi:hypothetical protein DPMN_162149 [Dreissena polymorpha]|uniref:Uncharacterized protein n=1 Tax=Dreissena polymorpha TaxID=45954 RepID=A0A9D4EPU4_DREPO|nr:hypothetical protein DPMN_162149 [Dreissena polymorpha]
MKSLCGIQTLTRKLPDMLRTSMTRQTPERSQNSSEIRRNQSQYFSLIIPAD